MKIKGTYLVSSCIMSKTLQCKYLKKYDNNNNNKNTVWARNIFLKKIALRNECKYFYFRI